MKNSILNLIAEVTAKQQPDRTDNNITSFIEGQNTVIEQLEKLLAENYPVHEFEVGDVAFCPYYNKKGIISSIKPTECPDIIPNYIILQNPANTKDYCVTTLRTQPSDRTYPLFLQLICKKEDYENIAEKTIFNTK